jgi:hypothetical protein
MLDLVLNNLRREIVELPVLLLKILIQILYFNFFIPGAGTNPIEG